MSPHDGRFAPSPTGRLHLGSLRTALVAWLFARSQQSRFLLRVEDLDPQRSRPEHERSQLADLEALGIDWDEPPVRQSERSVLYDEALTTLARSNRLYPCFCTRAEIRAAASAPHEPDPTPAQNGPDRGYPGTCRSLSQQERATLIREGRQYALRVAAGGELIEFEDRLLGRRARRVDDFVVRRADGVHAYQLAVVVDDADQGVGEVVRGADLVTSTPRQILLARMLGVPSPTYAHIPLVLGPDGQRLAKRHGTTTLGPRHEQQPGSFLAFLARSLGIAPTRSELGSAHDLIGEFEPARIPRVPLVLGPAAPV